MAVSNAHLETTCRVWDGVSYDILDVREAKKKEKAGLVQIVTDVAAADLKPASYFTKTELPPGVVTKPKAAKKRSYKTRQMKAE